MTLRDFFLGRAAVLSIVVIISLCVFAYMTVRDSAPSDVDEEEEQDVAPPTFTWSFEASDSLNLDGIPETDIYLTASYSSGVTERKLIDTVPSSCNELPESEEDSVPGVSDIQCYGAGLGYRYKVTEGANEYLVQRQMFEEGTPDYAPPASEYEVVAEFAKR